MHTDRTRAQRQKALAGVALIISIGYADPQLDVTRLDPLLKILCMPGQKPRPESLVEASGACTSLPSGIGEKLPVTGLGVVDRSQ
jgi:hypothetical protein